MGPKKKNEKKGKKGKQGKGPEGSGQTQTPPAEPTGGTHPAPPVEPTQAPLPAPPASTSPTPAEPSQRQPPASTPVLPPPPTAALTSPSPPKSSKKNRKLNKAGKNAAKRRDEALLAGAEGSGTEETTDGGSQTSSKAPSIRSVASFEEWKADAAVAPGTLLVKPDGEFFAGPSPATQEKDAVGPGKTRTGPVFGPPGGKLNKSRDFVRSRSASPSNFAAATGKAETAKGGKEEGSTLLVDQPTPPESVQRTLSTPSLPDSDIAISPRGEPPPIGHRPSVALPNNPPSSPKQFPDSPDIPEKSPTRTTVLEIPPLPISLTSPGGTEREPEEHGGEKLGKYKEAKAGPGARLPVSNALSPAAAKYMPASTKPLNIAKEKKPSPRLSETKPLEKIPLPKPLNIVKQKTGTESSTSSPATEKSVTQPHPQSTTAPTTTTRKPPPLPPLTSSKKSGLSGSIRAPPSPTKSLAEQYPTNNLPPLPAVKVTTRKPASETEPSPESPTETSSLEKTPAPSIAESAGSSSVKSKRQSFKDAFIKVLPSSKAEKKEFYSGGGDPKEKGRVFTGLRKSISGPKEWVKSRGNKSPVESPKGSFGGASSENVADDLIFKQSQKGLGVQELLTAYVAQTSPDHMEAETELVESARASTAARPPPPPSTFPGLDTEELVPQDIVRPEEGDSPPPGHQGGGSAAAPGAPPSDSSSSSEDEDDKFGDEKGEENEEEEREGEGDEVEESKGEEPPLNLPADLPDYASDTPEPDPQDAQGSGPAAAPLSSQSPPQGTEVLPSRLFETAIPHSDPRYRGPEIANRGRRMFEAIRDPSLLQTADGRPFDLLSQYENPRGPFTLPGRPRQASPSGSRMLEAFRDPSLLQTADGQPFDLLAQYENPRGPFTLSGHPRPASPSGRASADTPTAAPVEPPPPQGTGTLPDRLFETAIPHSDPRYRGPEFANRGRRMFEAIRDPSLLQTADGRPFDLLSQYENPHGPFTLPDRPRQASPNGSPSAEATAAAPIEPAAPPSPPSLFAPMVPPNPRLANVPVADTLSGLAAEGEALRFDPSRNFAAQMNITFDTAAGGASPLLRPGGGGPFANPRFETQLPTRSPPESPLLGSGSSTRTFEPFNPDHGRAFDALNRGGGDNLFGSTSGLGPTSGGAPSPLQRIPPGYPETGSLGVASSPLSPPPGSLGQTSPAAQSTTPLGPPPVTLQQSSPTGQSTTPSGPPPSWSLPDLPARLSTTPLGPPPRTLQQSIEFESEASTTPEGSPPGMLQQSPQAVQSTTPLGPPPSTVQQASPAVSSTPLGPPPLPRRPNPQASLSTTPLEPPLTSTSPAAPQTAIRRPRLRPPPSLAEEEDSPFAPSGPRPPPLFRVPDPPSALSRLRPVQDTPRRAQGQGPGRGRGSLFLPPGERRPGPLFGGPQPSILGMPPVPGNRPLGNFGSESPEELERIEEMKRAQGSGSGGFVKPKRAVMMPQEILDFEQLLRDNPNADWAPLANAAVKQYRRQLNTSVAAQVVLGDQKLKLLKSLEAAVENHVNASKKNEEDAQTNQALQEQVQSLEEEVEDLQSQLAASSRHSRASRRRSERSATNPDSSQLASSVLEQSIFSAQDAQTEGTSFQDPADADGSPANQVIIKKLQLDLTDCERRVIVHSKEQARLEAQIDLLQSAKAQGSLPEDMVMIDDLAEKLRVCEAKVQQMTSLPGTDVPLPGSPSTVQAPRISEAEIQARYDGFQGLLDVQKQHHADTGAEIQKLTDERNRYKSSLDECERANADMIADAHEMQRLKGLETRLKTITIERYALREALGHEGDAANFHQALDRLTQENYALREQIENLKQEIKDDFHKARVKLERHEERINAEWKNKVEMYRKQLEAFHIHGQESPSQGQRSGDQGDMIPKAQCDSEKEDLQTTISSLEKEKRLLEARGRMLEERNISLMEQSTQDVALPEGSGVPSLADELGGSNLSEEEVESADPEQPPSPADSQKDMISKEKCDLEKLDLRYELISKHRVELQEMISETDCNLKLKETRELYGQLRKRLAKMTDDFLGTISSEDHKKAVQSRTKAFEDCEKDKVRLVEVHTEVNKALHRKIKELEQQLRNLQDSDYESDFDPDQMEGVEEDNNKSKSRLMSRRNCENKISILRAQLADEQQTAAIQQATTQATIQGLNHQIATLNVQLTTLRNSSTTASEGSPTQIQAQLETQLQNFEMAKAALQTQLDTQLQTQQQNFEMATTALQKEIEDLKRRLKAKQKELDEGNGGAPAPDAVLQRLQKEIEQLEKEQKRLKGENARLRGSQAKESPKRVRGGPPPGDSGEEGEHGPGWPSDVQLAVIRTRLALARMARRRGIFGVNDGVAEEHLETARTAIQHGEHLAGQLQESIDEHREEWLGRTRLWHGIVEFYAEKYDEAGRQFDRANTRRLNLDDHERNSLRRWMNLLADDPKGAVTTKMDDYWTSAELSALKSRCNQRYDECKERKRARRREAKRNHSAAATEPGSKPVKKARFSIPGGSPPDAGSARRSSAVKTNAPGTPTPKASILKTRSTAGQGSSTAAGK